jgi:hypothetical protein
MAAENDVTVREQAEEVGRELTAKYLAVMGRYEFTSGKINVAFNLDAVSYNLSMRLYGLDVEAVFFNAVRHGFVFYAASLARQGKNRHSLFRGETNTVFFSDNPAVEFHVIFPDSCPYAKRTN